MSQWDTGRWVSVALPDGSSRYDWIPDNQPPSPDGSPGVWHGVGEPGMPGVWEWHPTVAEPVVAEPVVADPVVAEPVVPEPVVPEPPAEVPADRPNPWLATTEIQPEPERGGRRGLAHPGVIITGIVAAVVAGVVVLSLVLQDDDEDEKQTVTSSQPSEPTSTPSATPSESPSSTPTSPSDADLDFPKSSGDWTLYDVDLVENSQGLFSGTGKIGYDGSKMGATANFTLTIYSEGRAVGTMTAGTSQAKPRTSTQVTWESSSTWVEDPDGYTFSAR